MVSKLDSSEVVIWRVSSHCVGGNGCVEVANLPTKVAVRDSTDPQGPFLMFAFDQWRAFIADIRECSEKVTG